MPRKRSPGVPDALSGALDDEVLALLRLRMLPGLGDVRGRALLEHHGSAIGAWASVARTMKVPATLDGWLERALATIEAQDIVVLPCWDRRYPPLLNQLHDRPLVVFARGDLGLLDSPAVAVVGTRAATEHGLDAAHSLAGGIAKAGITVVSGLARGIDTAAHRAALAVGGATIAVLGTGIDVAYPHESAALQETIALHGLLLSEFLPGTPPDRFHFVRRNRIIAALARAVVVVEAPARSGALSTVEHALDLNRDVLVVPGPVGRASCEGTNRLLREGAGIVLEPADVLDALGATPRPPAPARRGAAETIRAQRTERERAVRDRPPPDDAEQAALWEVLGWDGDVHLDVAAERAGVSAPAAAAALLQMELDGRVRRAAGMRFRRAG